MVIMYVRFYCIVVVSVRFQDSSYIVTEKHKVIRLRLTLSNPSSTNITVTILNIDDTATGMYSLVIIIISNYIMVQ